MIINRKPKQIPLVYSIRLRTFIDLILQKQPNKRPSASEALKMIPNFAIDTYQKKFLPTEPDS